jgi:SAM-dependent methyltransferase
MLHDISSSLICPECHSPATRNTDRIVCTSCKASYEIVNSVPVLLTAEDRIKFNAEVLSAKRIEREIRNPYTSKMIKAVKSLVGSSLSLPKSRKLKCLFKNSTLLTLNIGSGNSKRNSNTINLDISLYRNVNIVGNAMNIPIADATFDFVINIALLEHLEYPEKAVAEMHRVLKPGGYLYTVTPFLLHYHGYPNDYQRFTKSGLQSLFRDLEFIEEGTRIGPSSTISTLVADWFELFTFSEKRCINDIVRFIALVLVFPLKFFDYLLSHNPRSHEMAQAIYILVRKK